MGTSGGTWSDLHILKGSLCGRVGDKLQGGEGRETSQEVPTAIQGEMMEVLERGGSNGEGGKRLDPGCILKVGQDLLMNC